MSHIESIPLKDLHESPTNPRRSFGDMTELVESIRRAGVLQPLLARPVNGSYELVFGHRRLRAAREAELENVPVMVREMSDKEVLEAQLIENCQRQDIHPLEEADGYRRLHEDHGYAVDELAAKVGKSKAYVYARMKLCSLSDKVRKACLEDQVSHSVALLIARIPVPKLQDEALKDVLGAYHEPMSAREAGEHIRRRFMLRLKDAPFDKRDGELVPEAGPCTTCPKRTGNQPELFDDVKSGDVCIDPTCFAKKREVDWERRTAEAEAKGQRVLSDKECKKLFPYSDRLNWGSPWVDLNDACGDDPKRRHWRRLLGKDVPTVSLARDAGGGTHELVERKRATELLKARHPEIAKTMERDGAAGGRHQQEEARRQRAQKAHRMAVQAAMAELVARVAASEPTAEFWRLVLGGLTEGSWHDTIGDVLKRRGLEKPKDKSVEQVLVGTLERMSKRNLAALAVELVCTRGVYWAYEDRRQAKLLKRACALYDVDWTSHVTKAWAEVRAKAKPKARVKKKTTRKRKAKASTT